MGPSEYMFVTKVVQQLFFRRNKLFVESHGYYMCSKDVHICSKEVYHVFKFLQCVMKSDSLNMGQKRNAYLSI